ncbi:hypothetical protein Zmor_019385 [Zophobas morio]|uniref:Gustatory receptor n=1 Tax=Zophobas morio TaxID=2755281 RepID=A0AA38M8Q2_9CUCU|nr:hypothetical protein Zmor_019385 [Zophobas morio]
MSFKLLKMVFKVGNILAITPSYDSAKTESSFDKIYNYCMMAVITGGLAISVRYRVPDYSNFPFMKAVVQVLLDSSLYVLNMYSILAALRKKPQWYKLLKNLKTVQTTLTNENLHCSSFVVLNAIFCTYQVYMTWVVTYHIGSNFYKQFAIEYLQFYHHFVVNYLLFAFLKMLLERYQSVCKNLTNHLQLVKKLEKNGQKYTLLQLKKIKYDVCLLKESVDIVNSIFGWPILLIVAFTSLQMLVYLEQIVVRPHIPRTVVGYIIVIILWDSMCLFTNIFLCDSVTNEGATILAEAYTLEKYFTNENSKNHEDLRKFIDALKNNLPCFTAARFFVIDRSTVFGIFDAVVSFLIVMIQFEMSRSSKGGCQVCCNNNNNNNNNNETRID